MRALTTPTRGYGLPLLLGLLLTPALVSAAPPSDPTLELRARSALAADRSLAGLTLFVSVVDRIAVVGGAVPDAAAAARVEAALKAVPGLDEVRVACWVPGVADDPLRQLVADRLRDTDRPPLALTPRAGPEPPPVVALAPPAPDPPRPADTVTVQRIAAPALADLLLAPVAANGVLPAPAPARAYPTIPPPAVPTTPTATVPTVLAALRRDPRFGGLTVEFRPGAAVITGRAAHSADAWAFADAVRKRPGVGRVVVGDVDVP